MQAEAVPMADRPELSQRPLTEVVNNLTPVNIPLIPRCNGDGCYEVGDRVLAHDVVADTVRAGTVGAISSDGKSDYLIVTYGDELFEEYFLAQADDIRDVLPNPDDADALEAWLEDRE